MNSKYKVIVSGDYTSDQVKAFDRDFDATFIKQLESIVEIKALIREQVEAVAFKGHKPLEFDVKKFDMVPNLKVISNFGVGYDAVDINEATRRGVKVSNTPDVLNDDVADLAIGMLIAFSRKFLVGADWIKSGNWMRLGEMPLNRKISGCRAGILGLGRIGREIANRLVAFKMDIHYHSRRQKRTPDNWTFHEDPISLAKCVDFLFIALVGGEETQKLVSASVIDALGSNGILINISRGSTVDEEALIEALQKGSLRGAALDVFCGEPNIDPRFLNLENVLLQPHQGSGTVETRAAMSKLQRDNLLKFFSNQSLLTPVN